MGNYGAAVVVLPLLMILEGFGRLEKWSSTPLAFLNFVAASMEAFSTGFEWEGMLPVALAMIRPLEIILVEETSLSDDNFLLRIFFRALYVWVWILLLMQTFSNLPGIGHGSDETERTTENVIVRADHGEADDGFFGETYMGNYGAAVAVLPLLMILEGFGRLEKWSSTPLAFLNFVAASMEAFSTGFEWEGMLPVALAMIRPLEIILVEETSLSDDNFLLRIFFRALYVWVWILLLMQTFSNLPGIGHGSDETERTTANVIVRADHGEAGDGFFGWGTVLLFALYLLLYSVLGTSTSKSVD